MRRPISRDILRGGGISPDGQYGDKLLFILLSTFFPRRKKVAKNRRSGQNLRFSPRPQLPRDARRSPIGSGAAIACFVSATSGNPPLRRSALGLIKKPFGDFLLVKRQSSARRIREPTVLTANGNRMLIFHRNDNAAKSFSYTRNFSPYMSLPLKVRAIASIFEETLGTIRPTSHLPTGAV